VFYEPASSLILESAEVLDVSNLDGRGEVSDHFPVSATFRKSAVGGHFPRASQ
jgi:hypothetical protein